MSELEGKHYRDIKEKHQELKKKTPVKGQRKNREE